MSPCARLFHSDYQLCGQSLLIHCFPPYGCTISAYNYNFTTTPSFNFLAPSDALFLQFCKVVCVWVEKWTESGSEQPPSVRNSSINRWDELPEVSFFHCRLFSAFFTTIPNAVGSILVRFQWCPSLSWREEIMMAQIDIVVNNRLGGVIGRLFFLQF